MNVETLTLPSLDGFPLNINVFHPTESVENPSSVILIGSALSAPKTMYEEFAKYLSSKGIVVVTSDPRGIGSSKVADEKRNQSTTIFERATLDQPFLLVWISKRWKNADIYFIGHSLGGQMCGINPMAKQVAHLSPSEQREYLTSSKLIKKALYVSTQSGYWWLQPSPWFILFFIYFIIPYHIWKNGYLTIAAEKYVPREQALEWGRWIKSRDYLTSEEHFKQELMKWNPPSLTMLNFKDDDVANDACIQEYLRFIPKAKVTRLYLSARDLESKGVIGHFGFFYPKYGKEGPQFWDTIVDWTRGKDFVLPRPTVIDTQPSKL